MGDSKFIAAAFIILLLHLSHAQSVPEKVNVSLYLLDISKYDVKTGEFTADFYLDFRCADNCSPERFEFMNGRGTSISEDIDTPTEKFYRIQGTFTSPVNLERYPFDKQTIWIVLEDKLKTTSELGYIADGSGSGVDGSTISPGWEIRDWNASVDEHYYTPYNETYSRYTFSVGIERVKLNALLKTFIPLFFIIFITLASLYLPPEDMGFRIAIGGSTLVTTVLLHLSLLSEIPPTPYLTFTDKFMFLTYTILLLSFLVNILILKLKEMKRPKTIARVQEITEWAVLLVPVVYILLFYLMLS